jgi:hypothetical protein
MLLTGRANIAADTIKDPNFVMLCLLAILLLIRRKANFRIQRLAALARFSSGAPEAVAAVAAPVLPRLIT